MSSFSMQCSSTRIEERTPKTPRSIVRNHSPYCESTGPIVQEGFVAARVRALQGFSDQPQTLLRPHCPITPCPRPSMALKAVLASTKMPNTGIVKRFHNQLLSKEHWSVLSTPGESARFADVALAFQRQKQQSSLRPATPSRSCVRGRGTEPPSTLLEDTVVASSRAQRNHVATPKTPYEPESKVDRVDTVPAETSSPAETYILSPHAIQADLVEPRATWTCLPQTEDRNNDYIREQASKPRGSIADKLGSMVEQGWVGGDTFGIVNKEGGVASHTTESKYQIDDTTLDSGSDMPRLKKMSSSSNSSASTAEVRSEMQHSIDHTTSPYRQHKETKLFVHYGSQKRRKRQMKRSSAVQTPQRSSSDFGVRHLKTELASPHRKRRARTIQYLGRSAGVHSSPQPEGPPSIPSIWPSHTWDYRSNKQDHESTKSPPSRGCSILHSAFDLKMLRDEQLDLDSPALLKDTDTRCSSSNTKESARSTSRSTPFFRKFPWYKVALVDKQPVLHSLSKGDYGNSTSRTTRVGQHDPPFDQIELSRHFSKSFTPAESTRGEGDNLPTTRTTPHQAPINQQDIDTTTSYYRASRQPTLQLVTSPQEINEQKAPEKIQKALERTQELYATSFTVGDERLSKTPPLIVNDVTGHAQRANMTGLSGTQPRDPSQSGSFESPRQEGVLQSFQFQGPKTKQHPHKQSYTSSHKKSTKLRADTRPEKGSSSSEIARPQNEFSAGPSLDRQPRSEVVNFAPKRSGNETGSLPSSVHGSDQDGLPRRQVQGGGKGIKKIQVTVTFDGAEDLVVEAMLKTHRRER